MIPRHPSLPAGLALLILSVSARPLAAEPAQALFERGLSAFEKARAFSEERPTERETATAMFREAAEHFEGTWKAGGSSPAVLANAANSHYFAGDLGEAVLFYRRAAALAPTDSSIRGALEHVRAQLPIRRAEHGATDSLVRSLFFWHGSLSARERRLAFMILFPTAFLALGVGLWRGTLWRRLGYALLALSLAPLGSLVVDAFSSSLRSDAVVVVEVEGRRGNGSTYSASHSEPFPAGTEVTIQETRESAGATAEEGSWIHVTLLDGSRSWIPSDTVEQVLVDGL